jgi:UDP-glucose 4-epimerase
MTAGPTLATAAAARGDPFMIGWSSRSTLNYAADTARAFVDAARGATEGAPAYNVPGETVHMREVVAAIEAAAPDARVDHEDVALPFPEQFATGGLVAPVTPLAEGVRETIELFRLRAA